MEKFGEKFSEFVVNHYLLSAGFLIVLFLLIKELMRNVGKAYQEILPAEVTRLINHEDALVIDIREEKDFQKGHILNAMHLPLGLFESKLNKLEKHKSKPIILSCNTGKQSDRACAILVKNGYEKIFNLKGGVSNWQAANLPLTKS